MNSTRWATLVATWGGLGYWPVGPGTAGSVAAVLLGWLWVWSVSAPAWTLGVLGAVLIPIGAWAARGAEKTFGEEDPSAVIVDEVSGQWIALTFVRPDRWQDWLLGLLLFRLFDIWKPGPIRPLEKLSRGYGVMADDVAAGLCAMMIVGFYRWLL